MEIINNYKDLSIGKYQEIVKLFRDESMDDMDRQVSIMAILADTTEDVLLNLPLVEFSQMSAQTRFLNEPSPENHNRIADQYCFDGWTLIPSKDFSKVTTAQYIDFQNFCKGGEDKTVEILSVFLVPKGKTYNTGYDIVALQRSIREHLSVSDVLSLSAFFLRSYFKLIEDSLTSSKGMLKGMKNPKRKELMKEVEQLMTLLQGGDGSQM